MVSPFTIEASPSAMESVAIALDDAATTAAALASQSLTGQSLSDAQVRLDNETQLALLATAAALDTRAQQVGNGTSIIVRLQGDLSNAFGSQ